MNPPAPAQTPTNNPQPDSAPLKTDIVNNIPLHMAGSVPAAPKPPDELDKIMQDVGNELKKDDRQPHKRHLFGGKRKKPAPAQPSQPMNPSHPVQPHPVPATTHQAPAPPAAKPKAKNTAPVFVIFMTLTVAGILIAAAVAAYR